LVRLDYFIGGTGQAIRGINSTSQAGIVASITYSQLIGVQSWVISRTTGAETRAGLQKHLNLTFLTDAQIWGWTSFATRVTSLALTPNQLQSLNAAQTLVGSWSRASFAIRITGHTGFPTQIIIVIAWETCGLISSAAGCTVSVASHTLQLSTHSIAYCEGGTAWNTGLFVEIKSGIASETTFGITCEASWTTG